jgi:RNA polymerase sigma-70 factor (ECF subfamily)
MNDTAPTSDEDALAVRLRNGDRRALGELFDRHRERLWRMVRFRMDRRLASRIDPDDVLQEAYVAAASRLQHYGQNPDHSPFIWFRLIVGQTMIDIHRRHIGAQMRDADRDQRLAQARFPESTGESLVAELLGSFTGPSTGAMRAEATEQLRTAIAAMSELDQEIIALRHFEDLTNAETAEALGIQPTAASNRYIRAIVRLRDILAQTPGFRDPTADG